MASVAQEYYESSKLAKYPFEPYWGDKLRICVTGAGGFIASHLARRLRSEGHYVLGCDWKRNEHMPVRAQAHWGQRRSRGACGWFRSAGAPVAACVGEESGWPVALLQRCQRPTPWPG